MTGKLMHMRGDAPGMLLFFVFLFLGLWQFLVAWKRLNGLSLTGYPDRRWASLALGISLVAGSCGLYFSRPGHFASPDVEGFETIALLVVGLIGATLIQLALSSLFFTRRVSIPDLKVDLSIDTRELEFQVEGSPVPATYRTPGAGCKAGIPVLLLHDYGGSRTGTGDLAAFFSARGHPVLSFDLDGHGNNPRGISSPLMEELLARAARTLEDLSGWEKIAAIGLGLGGALAMELAGRNSSIKLCVSFDPPARETCGNPAVNAARELKAWKLVCGFARPPARGSQGGRISLSRLIKRMPPPAPLPSDRVVVAGSRQTWLNSPEALLALTRDCSLEEPLLFEGNHSTLAFGEDSLQRVADMLE